MKHTLTFVTGNAMKAAQLSRHLKHPVLYQKLDIPEIQSLDLEKVAKHKAREAFRQLKTPVVVEDTSLVLTALGNLPGPFIKWFLEEPRMRNIGLCRILDGKKNRNAIAKVCFAYCDGKTLKVFEGKIQGTITKRPRGKKGFGFDPIFVPNGHEKTWGEMSYEEQGRTSMRKIALKKLEKFLKKNNF